MKKKINCWEYFKCGREAGGENIQKLGECIVSKTIRANGINKGDRGGRICWCIRGSLCGEMEGEHSQYDNCLKCEFLHQVRTEEKQKFVLVKPKS